MGNTASKNHAPGASPATVNVFDTDALGEGDVTVTLWSSGAGEVAVDVAGVVCGVLVALIGTVGAEAGVVNKNHASTMMMIASKVMSTPQDLELMP